MKAWRGVAWRGVVWKVEVEADLPGSSNSFFGRTMECVFEGGGVVAIFGCGWRV